MSAQDQGFQMLRVFPLSLVGNVGGRNLRIPDLYKPSQHWKNNILSEGTQWGLKLQHSHKAEQRMRSQGKEGFGHSQVNVFLRR